MASLSSTAKGSAYGPTSLKIKHATTGDTRRISLKALCSFADLGARLESWFGVKESFVLTYLDEDEDTVFVTSEIDFEEAMAAAGAMGVKVSKFSLFASLEEARASSCSAKSIHVEPKITKALHPGIQCDRSGMNPIVGPRFHVLGNNYDLCEAEFDKLSEAERSLYVRIDKPGTIPIPCLVEGAPAPRDPHWQARRMAEEILGSANLPDTMNVDDMLLQAMIAASLCDDKKTAAQAEEGTTPSPLAVLLSAFMGPSGFAAVASTGANAGQGAGATPEAAVPRSESAPTTEPAKDDLESGGDAVALAQILVGLGSSGGCGRGRRGCSGGVPRGGIFRVVHPGIQCNRSGMNPIVGPRFHVLGNNHDLCEAEFDKLSEAERSLYVRIDKPGASPVPCLPIEQKDVGFALDKSADATTKVTTGPPGTGEAPAKANAAEEDDGELVSAPCSLLSSCSASFAGLVADEVPEAEAQKADGSNAAGSKLDAPGKPDGLKAELAQLEAMGFYDRAENLALLKRFGNRLDAALNVLLDSA